MYTALYRTREDGDYDFCAVVSHSELQEYDNQTLADFWNIEDSEDTLSSMITKVFDRISDIPEVLTGPPRETIYTVTMQGDCSRALDGWEEQIVLTTNRAPFGGGGEFGTSDLVTAFAEFLRQWYQGAEVSHQSTTG